jgi:hypothetical protein
MRAAFVAATGSNDEPYPAIRGVAVADGRVVDEATGVAV